MTLLRVTNWCSVLAIAAALLLAPETAAQEHAPLPDRLVAARAIYLINDSGDLKAYDAFFKELTRWNRFKIVASLEAADVVATLTSSATDSVAVGTATATSVGGVTTATGTATSVPRTFLLLRIVERQTSEPLWSDSVEKWINASHAPSKLVENLRNRFPKQK